MKHCVSGGRDQSRARLWKKSGRRGGKDRLIKILFLKETENSVDGAGAQV